MDKKIEIIGIVIGAGAILYLVYKFTGIFSGISKAFSGAASTVSKDAHTLAKDTSNAINTAKTDIGNGLNTAKKDVASGINTAKSDIQSGLNTARKTVISGSKTAAADIFKIGSTVDKLVSMQAANIGHGVSNALTSAKNTVQHTVTQADLNANKYLHNVVFPPFRNFGSQAAKDVNTAKTDTHNIVMNVSNSVTSAASSVRNAITGFAGRLHL